MPAVVRISAERSAFEGFAKLWDSREVLARLLLMEYQVRYRQTALGILWAVFQPVFAMGLFTFTFGHVAKFSSGNLPYPVFALTGLVVWYYFSNCLLHGGTSVVESAELVRQAAFPRVFFPLSVVLSKGVDAALAFLFLALFAAIYFPIALTPHLLLVPAYFFFGCLCTLGMTMVLSAVAVQFRDVKFLLPYLTQVLFFATPIVYVIPRSILEKAPWILWANPLSIWIHGFRQSLYPVGAAHGHPLLALALWAAALSTVGYLVFSRFERSFADTI